MFQRKLRALKFHHPDNFNVDDEQDVRTLVVWLEDQKIRFYPSEDRVLLRASSSVDWQDVFTKYLQDLKCPLDFRRQVSVLDWMLGYALRLEYADNCKQFQHIDILAHEAQQATCPDPASPLARLDPVSPEFKSGVMSLALLLNLPQHTHPVMVFQAARRLLECRFSQHALSSVAQSSQQSKEIFPLQKMDLGFDTKKKALNQAAKVLRLLHIAELRHLQTCVNEIIVAVQTLTANPKTDERLGKVGR